MVRSTDPKLLIINQNKKNYDQLRNFFRQQHFLTYESLNHSNSKIALRIKEIEPDILLINSFDDKDQNTDVLKPIASLFPEIPIIVLLNQTTSGFANEAIKLGAWDYIEYPVQDMDTLKKTVLKNLDRKRRLHATLEHQKNLQSEIKHRTLDLENRTKFLEVAEAKLINEIVHRKQIEKELRESKEVLDHALRIAHLGKWVWDIQSNEINWSDEMYAIYEMTNQQSIDLDTWSKMIYFEDQEYVDKTVEQAISGSHEFNIEYRITTLKGNIRHIQSEGEVFFNAQKDPSRIIGVIRDVTEVKQYQQKLKHAVEKAESASQAKSNFLTTMSHELRTPMHGVLGMAELVLLTDLDNDQRHYIDTIYGASQALLRVLNDILDISRIETNTLEVEKVEFDLIKTIECIDQLFSVSAKSKGLSFNCQFNDVYIGLLLGDSNRLTQILSNLIANAIKFTESGTVELVVNILHNTENQLDIQFEVSDTGIGISEEIQQFIFQPFTQEDSSSTRRYSGIGLGLAIVREIVELMGGQIGVRSQHGSGSSFWIQLSFEKVAIKKVETVSGPETKNKEVHCIQKSKADFKILLVEDDPISQIVMDGILKKLGYALDILPNGAAALSILSQMQYDIIFMDCRMPIKNGFETTKEIRAMEKKGLNGKYTPIIALTANAMTGDREKCLAAGMDDYLTKPLNMELIEAILKQYL